MNPANQRDVAGLLTVTKTASIRCVFCGANADRTVWCRGSGRILVCSPCRINRLGRPPERTVAITPEVL